MSLPIREPKLRTPATLMLATLVLATLALAPAARADHPTRHQMKKVKYLAHELSESAHYLHEQAASYAGHDSREEEAVYALHNLSKRAHDFYRAAGRHYRDPYRTEDAFRELIYAWNHAEEGFQYLYAYRHHRHEFRDLRLMMDDLVAYYGGYDAYRRPPHPRRHGKYHKIEKAAKILYLISHVLEEIDDDH